MDISVLKKSISLCKEEISTADQNLEKLTGRNLNKTEIYNNSRMSNKRKINEVEEVEVKKTRTDREQPSLNSVVKMAKGRTRDDALTELKKRDNPLEKQRCKRLFGHLMGTLNSIKKESERSSNDPQNITRLKIEKKVEESNKQIIETIRKEQSELLRTKKDCQNDLKILNQRYRAAEAFERWKVEKEKMKGYIRTSVTPHVFYLPKIINDESKLRQDQTVREIEKMIENRKRRLENDIEKAVKLSESHLIHSNEGLKREEQDDTNKNDEWTSVEENDTKEEPVQVKMEEDIPPIDKSDENNDTHSIAASEDYDDVYEIDISESKIEEKQTIEQDDNTEQENNNSIKNETSEKLDNEDIKKSDNTNE